MIETRRSSRSSIFSSDILGSLIRYAVSASKIKRRLLSSSLFSRVMVAAWFHFEKLKQSSFLRRRAIANWSSRLCFGREQQVHDTSLYLNMIWKKGKETTVLLGNSTSFSDHASSTEINVDRWAPLSLFCWNRRSFYWLWSRLACGKSK